MNPFTLPALGAGVILLVASAAGPVFLWPETPALDALVLNSGCPACPAEVEFDGGVSSNAQDGPGIPTADAIKEIPHYASASFRIVTFNWHRLQFVSGRCGPITPSGCAADPGCDLTTSGGDAYIEVIDEQPGSGSKATGPLMPSPPWNNSNAPHYRYTISSSDPVDILCGQALDLSFTYKGSSGNPRAWTLKFKCGENTDCTLPAPIF